MKEQIAHLALLLKETRLKKKLSQRALSLKTKVPQSHLSKIENGEIDLQASSLIEISRALGLELMLIPRNMVPTIEFLIKEGTSGLKKQVPKYRLDDEEENEDV